MDSFVPYSHVLAECEIRSLLLRERYFKDSDDFAHMRACYHPDPAKTHIKISWYTGDIDGLIAGAQRLRARGMVHELTPVRIDVRGARALAESRCRITSRFVVDGIAYDGWSLVRAFSQLERVGSAWKVCTMEVVYVRDGIVPVVPLAGPCALDFSRVAGARESYRYLKWHVEMHGGTVGDDLPGEDVEESVKEVQDRNRAWIEAVEDTDM